MKHILVILTILSINIPFLLGGMCHAAEADWAIGRWVGYIRNWPIGQQSRDIGARELMISTTEQDAAANAFWSAPAATPAAVTAKIDRDGLSFEHDGATVDLLWDGDAKLSGMFVGRRGKSFELTLTRPNVTTAYDGTWTGTAEADGPKCVPGKVLLSVSKGKVTGTVRYARSNDGGNAEIEHISDVNGEVWADGLSFLRLRKRDVQGRNSWFHAQIDNDKMMAKDPAYVKGACAFVVTLQRSSP